MAASATSRSRGEGAQARWGEAHCAAALFTNANSGADRRKGGCKGSKWRVTARATQQKTGRGGKGERERERRETQQKTEREKGDKESERANRERET